MLVSGGRFTSSETTLPFSGRFVVYSRFWLPRPEPPNKLTVTERDHVLSVLRSPEYRDLARELAAELEATLDRHSQ